MCLQKTCFIPACFNKINRGLENRLEAKEHPAAVLIDLSSAFDSRPINLLIAKLAFYGVGKYSIKLLQSYLTDRKQIVKARGYFSSWRPLNQSASRLNTWIIAL